MARIRSCGIAYDSALPAAAVVAKYLCECLSPQLGEVLAVRALQKDAPSCGEIRLCAYPAGTRYGDGALFWEEDALVIAGNDVAGLGAAAACLAALMQSGELGADALPRRFSLQERAAYVRDAEAFSPIYGVMCCKQDADLSLAHKREVLRDAQGRPFVIAHRGEHIFYPENSLEGALSAWCCGADSVEVDIQQSADGVWMCMHDSDVTRTTNAADLLGTAGYPTSPQLCDWTYAQLRTLCLRDAYGDLTPFPIPTLCEILHACDGRIYLHLDKRFSMTEEIFPILDAEGVRSCVYLCNHINLCDVFVLKDHFAAQGVTLENVTRPRGTQTVEDLIPTVLAHREEITPALIPLGDYVKHGERERELIAQYCDRIRFGAWFLRDFDEPHLWRAARAEGVSIFMTDHPIDLIALGL